jgi:electron transfer flavoprotein beta subunit
MKILVLITRVEDPEIKIKVRADGKGIETDGMKYVVNPFDEIAVEEALRIRDTHGGEVVVGCVGPKDATHQIRTTLAMGADKAVHVVTETDTDPSQDARAYVKLVEEHKPDLVLMGKQAIDDDMGQTGILLAEALGLGQVTCASKEESLESEAEKAKKPAFTFKDGRAIVVREVDGGIETLSVALPAVITCELRLNVPRYASLPGIMKAKKKEIAERPFSEFAGGHPAQVVVHKMVPPPARKAGVKVPDVATLMGKLRQEAKVI